jgi:hypothetical protein
MKRRQILVGGMVAFAVQLAASVPAFAATYLEQIVSQLQGQGFTDIEIESTWLGRTRIQAKRGDVGREIVLNPNTGEILRDLWLSDTGDARKTIKISEDNDKGGSGGSSGSGGGSGGNTGSGGGSGGGEEHEGESGSGGNSGSGGGGNSGSGGGDDDPDHD